MWSDVFYEPFTVWDESSWWRYGPSDEGGASGQGWRPERVQVADRQLRLTCAAEDGWRNAGVGSRWDQLYGRFTVQARIEKGAGCTFVLLLWPASNVWADGEIDFAEDNGGPERDYLSWTVHHGEESRAHGSVTVDLTQWHVFTVEWMPERIVTLVDGVAFGRFEDHPVHVPMRLALQSEAWPVGRGWNVGIDESTPSEVCMYVDQVRIQRLNKET